MGMAALAMDPATKMGNPLLARFPASDDARPRSIWDLQVFDGKIYMASGDYWNNTGPVDIWTYAGTGTNFVKEYVVQEEMVWDFFVQDGLMFIPGVDNTAPAPVGANLYINDPAKNPHWTKLSTLSGARHSYDVALFQGKLYASVTLTNTTGQTLVSSDGGQQWSIVTWQYSALVAFDDFLFLQGPTNYVYEGQSLRRVTPTVHLSQLAMARRARYRDGLLYAYPVRYMLTENPLYFISANQITNSGTATAIPAFANACVRDIVVRDDFCFVMTADTIQTDTSYRGRIYASDDLVRWELSTEFTVPGIPLSFEILNNQFYVGLGSRFDGTNWATLCGPAAGSLWRVAPQPQMADLRMSHEHGLRFDLTTVPGLSITIEATPSLTSPQWMPLMTTNVAGESFIFVDPDAIAEPIRFYRMVY